MIKIRNLRSGFSVVLAFCLLLTTLSACAGKEQPQKETEKIETESEEETSTEKESTEESTQEDTTESEAESTTEDEPESEAETTEETTAETTAAALDPLVFEVSAEADCKKVSFNVIPEAASQFEGVDITDEYISCAAIMLAFVLYETAPEEALKALTVLSGPNGVSAQDESFIKSQFDQYPYVARSYFGGASAANDYLISENSIVISENPYSRTEEGYVTLWLTSGGADSQRELQLRKKGSTGEWFMNSYMGVLSGIRKPESADLWDGHAGSDLRTFDDTVTEKSGSGDEAKIFVKEIPRQADFEKIDLTDEYKTAAAVIYALSLYESDPDACFAALDYLNGPTALSDYDKSFIKEQFSQYPYVVRSFFEGAVPSNDYEPASYTVTISENVNSFSADNFVTVYAKSNGADNPRSMTLRLQRSTGMWFVTSFAGILMGVKAPASADPWN